MKQTDLIKLTTILFLGIALIVGRNAYQKHLSTKPNDYLKSVGKLDVDIIKDITITQKDNAVHIVRTAGEWKVASKSANSTMVNDFIKSLAPSTPPLLVAKSQAQKDKMAVDDQHGYKINITRQDDSKLTLFLGPKKGSTNPVSIGDQVMVYRLLNVPDITVRPEKWVDLKIVDIDSDKVQKLTWNDDFYLSKNDSGQWNLNDDPNISVNNDAVGNFLLGVNPLMAEEMAFEQKVSEYNTSNPELTFSIVDKDGNQTDLKFYQGEHDYLVQRLSDNNFYIISDDTADDFLKTQSDFILNQ